MRRELEGAPTTGWVRPLTPWPVDWTSAEVIAALEERVVPARRIRLNEVLDRRLTSVTVVMDAPHDPHNAAAILRSCDAFGIQRAHVVLREEPFEAATRVAKGSERWVDVRVHANPAEAVSALDCEGFELVATHPRGELVPDDLAAIPRLALLVGNEHDGIRRELETATRRAVRVPMSGFVESLNVSVSAGILLAAATRARSGDLDEKTRRELYARWLFQSVPRAFEVLSALRSRPGATPR